MQLTTRMAHWSLHPPTAKPDPAVLIKGKVASLSTQQIVVNATAGKTVTIKLDGGTLYQKLPYGIDGTFKDLHAGSEVIVHYGMVSNVATVVEYQP